MLDSMSRVRRRAAVSLLVWLALSLLASPGVGHAALQTDAAPATHCHEAPPAPVGEPARNAAPPRPAIPCQWALPLLCCEQPAAADAGGGGIVEPPALWLRPLPPAAPAPWPASRIAAGFLVLSLPPSLERSVVLQV